eukprot:CAMPEP_0119060728 /NCGR_PEP_ID=MMETSP1178-20130426/4654_1 /TAXON_ID=33656 /ORGANISM="unid sp, Strain CCMP2000" /LENGTH=127 /DNA_ID=CAMNT_0007041859 /DNA_START=884 /DNA_END=1269 /DNA_ORIENTATION=+
MAHYGPMLVRSAKVASDSDNTVVISQKHPSPAPSQALGSLVCDPWRCHKAPWEPPPFAWGQCVPSKQRTLAKWLNVRNDHLPHAREEGLAHLTCYKNTARGCRGHKKEIVPPSDAILLTTRAAHQAL